MIKNYYKIITKTKNDSFYGIRYFSYSEFVIFTTYGGKYYFKNSYPHRKDGPAASANGHRVWWIEGKRLYI